MANIIESRAILSAADKTGGVFAGIAQKIAALNRTAARANHSVARTGAAATAAMGRTAAQASRSVAARADTMMVGAMGRLAAPVLAGTAAVAAYKNFARTDLAIFRIGVTADATDAQIREMEGSLKRLAINTGKPLDEVLQGMNSLVAGGMNMKEAMQAIPAITKTAQASGAEVKDIADTVLVLNQALGISAKSMQGAFDIMVAGGKAGRFELKDMASELPSILPAAAAQGLRGEEGLRRVVALLQTIRMGTGTSEKAATNLQNVFQKMESTETAKHFKDMGVTDLRDRLAKARKEGKDLTEVYLDLTQAAIKGDMSKLSLLFTDRQMQEGMRALMMYRTHIRKFEAEMGNVARGVAQRDLERVLARPQIAVNQLVEATTELGRALAYAANNFMKLMGSSKNTAEQIMESARIIQELVDDPTGYFMRRREANLEANKHLAERQRAAELDDRIDAAEAARRERTAAGLPVRPGVDDPGTLNKLRRERDEAHKTANKNIQEWQVRLRTMEWLGSKATSPDMMSGAEPFWPTPRRGIKRPKDMAMFARPLPGGVDFEEGRLKGPSDWFAPDALRRAPAGGFPDVKAELTGEAKVSGKAEVGVTIDLSAEAQKLLRALPYVGTLINLQGMLKANNAPGSSGTSSNDAAPQVPQGVP